MIESDVTKAVVLLERYLIEKYPDYRTLTIAQAQDVLSMRAFDIWQAWVLLSQQEN